MRREDSPFRGLAFWQVGALDPGMAKVSEKYLQDSGLPVRLETTADPTKCVFWWARPKAQNLAT